MALERRNPLPEGRYWIMLIGNFQIEKFDEWLKRHKDLVGVVSSELDPGGTTFFGPSKPEPPTQFVVFDVDFDDVVRWEGPGFPNIVRAGEDVTSRQDVEDVPIVDDPTTTLATFFDGLDESVPILIAVGLAIYFSSKR